MKITRTIVSCVLGVLFVFAGVMFFVMVWQNAPMPPVSGVAGDFSNALFVSGMMHIVKVMEIVFGVMLLIPRTRRLALILIAPIVLNIYLYEVLMVGSVGIGLVLVLINVFALYGYKDSYRGIVE